MDYISIRYARMGSPEMNVTLPVGSTVQNFLNQVDLGDVAIVRGGVTLSPMDALNDGDRLFINPKEVKGGL